MHRVPASTTTRLLAFQHPTLLSSAVPFCGRRSANCPLRISFPARAAPSSGSRRHACSNPPRAATPAAAAASTSDREEVAVVPRAQDFSAWYQSVITSGGLCESSAVRGCPIIKPHGYAIWELLRDELDTRIKAAGVVNAYFPLLIPQSFLSRESEHVEGFAKECAVVTHHRLRAKPDGSGLEPDPRSALDDPLIVRPTSETIIWQTFARWVQSYRDLPLQVNQWANVVRWEMRTRPFLRTAEFLWQEGHTAHASAVEAEAKAVEMIRMYSSVMRDMLAIPAVLGRKSEAERFAGATETYTVEAMMQNGWALQAGTSHYLGTSFPRAFDVTYTDAAGEAQLPYGTSWGVTTRLLGALIMTHSDDTGLVLPPPVAPIQVAVVVIAKNDAQMAEIAPFVARVEDGLRAAGIRFRVDDRQGMRPGAKYYEWERKGVPLRLEVGPKDAKKEAVFAARRSGGKHSIPVDDNFQDAVHAELQAIHDALYDAAQTRLAERMYRPASYDEMKAILLSQFGAGDDYDEGGEPNEETSVGLAENTKGAKNSGGNGEQSGSELGFFLVPWKSDSANEKKVKEETKATLRCYPDEFQHECEGKSCFMTGKPATHMAIFARAY